MGSRRRRRLLPPGSGKPPRVLQSALGPGKPSEDDLLRAYSDAEDARGRGADLLLAEREEQVRQRVREDRASFIHRKLDPQIAASNASRTVVDLRIRQSRSHLMGTSDESSWRSRPSQRGFAIPSRTYSVRLGGRARVLIHTRFRRAFRAPLPISSYHALHLPIDFD
jgi:hypothetical protein